ncbi:MAG: ComEC family competence protein [Sphingomonadales bacterium]|nr:ComEC family competence protein [Sphingomonadales bacterium]
MNPGAFPFIRLLLPLGFGVGLGLALPDIRLLIPLFLALLLLAVVGALLLIKKPQPRLLKLRLPLLLVLNLLLGYTLTLGRAHNFKSENIGNVKNKDIRYFYVRITEPLQQRTASQRAMAEVLQATDSAGNSQGANGKILLYWPQKSNPAGTSLQYGDVILIPKVLTPIPDAAFPEAFSFRKVVRPSQVTFQAYLTQGSYQKVDASPNPLIRASHAGVTAINRVLQKHFSPEKAALMSSLLLGYKADIAEEDLKAFSITGTIHVLAVSGMHVGLIYMALLFLFTGSLRPGRLKFWQGVSVLVFLWAYAVLTGLSASVVRATLMFSIMEAGRTFLGARGNTYNSLFAAAYIQLLISPHDLLDVGFQLSYLAVLGILFFYPLLNEKYEPKNRILRGAWQLSLVSISATLGTLPVTLFVFKSFPLLFIPANVFIVPVSTIVIFMGIAVVMFSWVPYVGVFLAWFTSCALDVLMVPARFMAKIPGASYTGFGFDAWDMVLVFLMVMVFGYAFFVGFSARNSLWLGLALVAYFGRRTTCRLWEEQTNEVIVFENRGVMAAVVKSGQRLDVLSSPVTEGRADTLRQLMRNYENAHRISSIHWHFFTPGDSLMLPENKMWRHAAHSSCLYNGHKPVANLLWLPDTSALMPAQNFSRQSYRRFLEGKNVVLLKGDFLRPGHDAGL